ncbi:hypothetical protein [Thiothrix sp.]|jgi:hypothetical protein|uniref:hypothetical protein n=1 Tax=Thiothrix sp. TaxID=1032 RepID=UPI00257DDE02|nr:hypothetical protein [Thiothrix sp.]
MSIHTVDHILHEAERLTFSEQLTLIQRLKQVLAMPAKRKLKTLELDTRGFQFDREEANERRSGN